MLCNLWQIMLLLASYGVAAVQEFNPQSLSNVLWAFASLKHHPGEALLDASATHAVRCVDQFTPQVLALPPASVCLCHLQLPHTLPCTLCHTCTLHSVP